MAFNIDLRAEADAIVIEDKPGGGYGALGGATNIRATAEERGDKQIIVLKCHKQPLLT